MRFFLFFFFSSRRRHTRSDRDWSSDVCSSDLNWLVAHLFEFDGKPLQSIARGEIDLSKLEDAQEKEEHEKAAGEYREVDEQRFADWTQILFDQAVLSNGGQLDDPASFVSRLNELLVDLSA